MKNASCFKFEELHVYQESLSFVDLIYQATSYFPKSELFGLTNQLQRASVSICLNIAEGSSRTKRDFQHFLAISRGSCFECAAILQIAFRRKYIDEKKYTELFKHITMIAKMTTALKNSL